MRRSCETSKDYYLGVTYLIYTTISVSLSLKPRIACISSVSALSKPLGFHFVFRKYLFQYRIRLTRMNITRSHVVIVTTLSVLDLHSNSYILDVMLNIVSAGTQYLGNHINPIHAPHNKVLRKDVFKMTSSFTDRRNSIISLTRNPLTTGRPLYYIPSQ